MKYLAIGIAVILVLVVGFAVLKKVSPLGWGMWGTTNTSGGVALRGYDAVSYFEDGGPKKGSDEYAFGWSDAAWHFASAANRDRFAAEPERFAPQFGGFCAFAVSKGFTADPDPQAWHIGEGRLFVFADTKVRDDWVAGLGEGSFERSKTNWAKR